MRTVRYESHSYQINDSETVLDALLRNGVQVGHACKAGSCGSCMLRAIDGEVPTQAQAGLKDSWKARGYFLACMCRPACNLTATLVESDTRINATITALDHLSQDVLRVRLACDAPLDFRPGQYVTLFRDNGLARSYSIASLPEEGEIELHVRRVSSGRMSGWLYEEARPGAHVQLQGPSGECFYVPGREDQPMLLIGTGTGLAPLYGILRDALRNGHRGPIHLFHGAVRPAGLYLGNELQAMDVAHANFAYTPSVLEADKSGTFEVGPIDRIVAGRFPKLDGWRCFVCGDPAMVSLSKKKAFLAGVAMRDIYADAFLPSAP